MKRLPLLAALAFFAAALPVFSARAAAPTPDETDEPDAAEHPSADTPAHASHDDTPDEPDASSAQTSTPAPDPAAERALQPLLQRQQTLFAQASGDDSQIDDNEFRRQAQQLSFDFESLLQKHPSAKGYAAFGAFLGKIDMRRESIAMLLKANQLDPNLPFVKNQIGNYLAEEGQPIDALNYFMAAIQLAPDEPLYHYQLGRLLYEARDDFLKSGNWTRADLDKTMHDAFHRAAELAPDRIEFTYRYAESFYDLEHPDWDAALKAWSELEEHATTAVERETMRLHAANIFIKTGRLEQARVLLATIHEPALDTQKQKLIAQLPVAPKK